MADMKWAQKKILLKIADIKQKLFPKFSLSPLFDTRLGTFIILVRSRGLYMAILLKMILCAHFFERG